MRTPLPAFIALVVISVTGLVGVTSTPAFAACDKPQAGVQISDTPSWPLRDLWDLRRLPSDASGAGIRVAVLDSGVDFKHPQLAGKMADQTDPLHSLSGAVDNCGHGTAVAGLIAAKKIDGVPFHGIAPDATILAARVSEKVAGNEDEKPVTDPQMAAAVRWAVAKDAKVINISFAYTSEVGLDEFRKAIAEAIAADVVVIAAVGNNNTTGNPTPYPAAWPGVVGVAAIGQDGTRIAESNVGDYVDISAPGARVAVPRPGGGYGLDDGTSFAAPMVAGAAALIIDRFPDLTGPEVVRRLLATADPAPGGRRSGGYGVGVVNPVRAVTDVVDAGGPTLARALPAPGLDPVAAGAAARAEATRQRALLLSGIGLLVAVLAVALMLALPAGVRRKWRPAGRG